MGVYLYGELMVNEDMKQQELAHKCFAAAREHMDVSSAKVVAEMLFWRGDFSFWIKHRDVAAYVKNTELTKHSRLWHTIQLEAA